MSENLSLPAMPNFQEDHKRLLRYIALGSPIPERLRYLIIPSICRYSEDTPENIAAIIKKQFQIDISSEEIIEMQGRINAVSGTHRWSEIVQLTDNLVLKGQERQKESGKEAGDGKSDIEDDKGEVENGKSEDGAKHEDTGEKII